MNAADVIGYVYDGAAYCTDHKPAAPEDEVGAIFADSEADCPGNSCDVCHEHIDENLLHHWQKNINGGKPCCREALEGKAQEFLDGYLECLLWCGVFKETDEGPEDRGELYDEAEIDNAAMKEIVEDCAAFYEVNAEAMAILIEHHNTDWGRMGHDFYLSRNGHGTGFWDRGYGEMGDMLHKEAKVYGSFTLFVGQDKDGEEVLHACH